MKKHAILFLAFFLQYTFILSAQPINDDCTQATILSVLYDCQPYSATTVNATQSVPPITCAALEGYSDDDVWFRFVATTHYVTIRVAGSSGFDAVVDFRSGECNGTTIACADATGSGGTETINKGGLYIGSTYLIRVYSYGNGIPAQGTFTICITGSLPYPPVNDDCPGAIWMLQYPDCIMYEATTISATQSEAPILCNENTGYADDDVWFIFKPTSDNPSIIVTGTQNFDAVVDLRGGFCYNDSTLFCADSIGSGGTEIINASGLSTKENYYVRVYGYGNGPNDQGDFSLCICESILIGNKTEKGALSGISIHPNPFSDKARIMYHLTSQSRVTLMVFDILGREVTTLVNDFQTPGDHETVFYPTDLNQGSGIHVYYCLFSDGDDQVTKKMIRIQ
jgi:hypothetical protein